MNLIYHLDEYPEETMINKTIDGNSITQHVDFTAYSRTILEHLFKNSVAWNMALGTMFLYVIRIGLLNWLPTFLVEQNNNVNSIGWQFSSLEFLGIFGGIVAGYFSDKVGYAHRSKIAMILILGLIICIAAFIFLPLNYSVLKSVAIILCGFFIYGPQVLAGVIANDSAAKSISTTVSGLVRTFGYIGATFSGLGLGIIVDKFEDRINKI